MTHRIYPDNKTKTAAWRADKRAKGLCGQCGKVPAVEFRCADCKEKVRIERGSVRRNKKRTAEDGRKDRSDRSTKTKNRSLAGWTEVGSDTRTT